MSKYRPRKRAKQKRKLLPPKEWWTLPRKVFAGLIAFLGVAAAVLPFLPRLTMTLGGDSDLMHGSFGTVQITNTGFVPLYDLQFMIGLCEIDLGIPFANTPHRDCHGKLTTRHRFLPWDRPRLGMDEPYTISVDDALRGVPPYGYANFSVVVSYRPWLWPWRREFEVRFVTKQLANGKLVFYARSEEG